MQILLWCSVSVLLGQTAHDRGAAEFQAGRFQAAKKYFAQAVREAAGSEPDLAAKLSNLAQAQVALGELALASETIRRSIDYQPKSAQLWNQLGQVLILRKQYREAEEVQRKALMLAGPGQPAVAAVIYSDLSLIYKEAGKNSQALESLESARALLPAGRARARVLSNLGMLCWGLGRKTEAASYLGRALQEMEEAAGQHHPDVGRILEQYSTVLSKSGQKQVAREMAARAEEIRSAALPATVDWRDLGTRR